MTIIFNPKSPLLVLTLASALLIVGCNKTTNNSTESTNESKDSAAVQTIDDNAYATAEVVGVPMAKAMIFAMVQSYGNEIKESERKCILESTNVEGKFQMGQYLEKHLTPEELKVSDDFYASPVGVRLHQIAEQQLAQLEGKAVSEPITLTPEEQAKFEEFQATPVATKIRALLSQDNTAKLGTELFKPILVKEFSRCNVQIEVPDL